jgi:uncharacterized protein YjiS (DUF1127 family)
MRRWRSRRYMHNPRSRNELNNLDDEILEDIKGGEDRSDVFSDAEGA